MRNHRSNSGVKNRERINNNNTVPTHYPMKIKESEKRNKYLDLSRKLRKLCNIKVTGILIVTSAHGTVPKHLQRGLEELSVSGQIESIQITTLFRPVRILRRILET